MNFVTVIATVFAFAVTAIAADPNSSPTLDPSKFIGKTFSECEKVLGKPIDPKDANGAFSRIYKSPVPGLTRIKLERVPDGYNGNKIPETVNFVWYFFPKETIETLGQAFKLIGASMDGASKTPRNLPPNVKRPDPATTAIQESDQVSYTDFVTLNQLKSGLKAIWTPSDRTEKMPEQYRNPSEDSLSFQQER